LKPLYEGIKINYTVSIIQQEPRERWGRRHESRERHKKIYSDNKKSKFLAKRTGISSSSPCTNFLFILTVF
jgi:hypothetical protein